jgi:hypothetical protein
MMGVMYRRFSTEHGFALSAPKAFTLKRCLDELAAIEDVYQKQFGAAAMLTMPQLTLMRKFFDSIASKVKGALEAANRDAQAWLKSVMAPLEAQIREHREQLKQRRASIERIHLAADDLEVKVAALEAMGAELDAHKTALVAAEAALKSALAAKASEAPLPA